MYIRSLQSTDLLTLASIHICYILVSVVYTCGNRLTVLSQHTPSPQHQDIQLPILVFFSPRTADFTFEISHR